MLSESTTRWSVRKLGPESVQPVARRAAFVRRFSMAEGLGDPGRNRATTTN